jgi:type IV pilus assembly protein PilV
MGQPKISPRPGQHGVALLEVLIALLICAFGILGVVGLQASMTRAQTAATFRAEASFLTQRLIGDMWADRANLEGYDTDTCLAACSAFLVQVADRLPSGEATVNVDAATRVVTIEIRWRPAGEGVSRYTTATAITNPTNT